MSCIVGVGQEEVGRAGGVHTGGGGVSSGRYPQVLVRAGLVRGENRHGGQVGHGGHGGHWDMEATEDIEAAKDMQDSVCATTR